MVNENDEFKLLRFGILEEMNKRFVDIMAELNSNDSALSKELAEEVKKGFLKNQEEHKTLKDWVKYELDTLKATNKILLEPDKGIIPKMEKKVATSITYSQDACKAATESYKEALESKKSAEKSEGHAAKTSFWVMAGVLANMALIITLVMAFATFHAESEKRSKMDLNNQLEMIKSLNEKIKQDAGNQMRTETIMNKLYKKLGGN